MLHQHYPWVDVFECVTYLKVSTICLSFLFSWFLNIILKWVSMRKISVISIGRVRVHKFLIEFQKYIIYSNNNPNTWDAALKLGDSMPTQEVKHLTNRTLWLCDCCFCLTNFLIESTYNIQGIYLVIILVLALKFL